MIPARCRGRTALKHINMLNQYEPWMKVLHCSLKMSAEIISKLYICLLYVLHGRSLHLGVLFGQ
jgi:hypothetical protein